jgi:hypothetical protein
VAHENEGQPVTAQGSSAAHTKLVDDCIVYLNGRTDVRAWRQTCGTFRALDGERIVSVGMTGIADIGGILGGTWKGRALAVECKTGRAKLSKNQEWFRQMFQRLGGLYVEARSVEDITAALATAPRPS